ncbi:hypothetical protein GCQ56_14790 [Marinifilum sp. N1E240]|uniref:hypothetical protein n=1 Tax=Marinifilum sp. N1E240 TaxID=2608082 RepID=UPI00128D50B1|nr:hypothetical protein [Marinifilum sp. N1E240]MPQ48268.1 hypothetical protein [Marinifilum sp. N1E240]
MKTLKINILLLLIPFSLIGQNVTVIHKDDNSSAPIKTKILTMDNHLAVIFPKEYEPKFNVEYLKNRFTPDSLIIKHVDKKIEELYIDATKMYLKAEWKTLEQNKSYYDWDKLVENKKEREKKLISATSKKRKKLAKMDRQYLGLINSKGERIILVQFIKLKKNDYNLRTSIKDEWIVGCGDWFEENTESYEYVIDRDKMYLFGWTER